MSHRKPRILITRPKAGAERFADILRENAPEPLEIMIAPLMEITFRDVQLPPGVDLVLTSVQAVRALGRPGGAGRTAYVVGGATARAAAHAGMHVALQAPNVRALVQAIKSAKPAGDLLYLRGAEITSDLVAQLRPCGILIEDKVVYDQPLLPLAPEARDWAMGEVPIIVPLFSARSAGQFITEWTGTAPLLGAFLSAAVQRAAARPWAAQVVSEGPDAASMCESVLGLLDAASRVETPSPRG